MVDRCEIILAVLGVGTLLTLILVPMTFSYVDYYEYGLAQRKTTGFVDVTKVYSNGRYALGPDYKFLKYQADAHMETLRGFSVFSASESDNNSDNTTSSITTASGSSVGLDFQLDIDYTFLLIKDEIGLIHQEIAKSYRNVIVSRANDAIKNEAARVTFTQYFRDREAVEARFRDAVQNRWNAEPPLHCTLDQFHLGWIQIPESVAAKQLEAKIQTERNHQEDFLQQGQIEREMTAVQVNTIALEQDKVLRTAQAEASLLRSKARSEAAQIIANAQTEGTYQLVTAADILSSDSSGATAGQQEALTAFTYIRTLQNRDNVDVHVNYLTPENIVKTRSV